MAALLQGGLLCNDASLQDVASEAGDASWRIIGDPTEGALVVAAAKADYDREDASKAMPRVQEIPFDSDRKRMTTIHRHDPAAARTEDTDWDSPFLPSLPSSKGRRTSFWTSAAAFFKTGRPFP